MQRLSFVVAIALAAGCVPTSYAYTPASSRSFEKRGESCAFEIVTTPPDKNFEEVGTLAHYNGDVPKDLDGLRKAIEKQVCNLGGDAVIAISEEGKGYSKATIIHWPRPFRE